ncbi:4-(cytidine 5'-diphospho)-2-C-methyl-D-erythritol kinase [Prosthecochloris sp. CIB 2401]|uniref:4-(cytidine 5'-diphospho)-2-C-methyl-D-erythritol kinase n=1 Tax=Prosthecochloris sp. CIB 2401 TaxID=1868325 RepID=UPI00080A979C|nr:4-(cytidine 5'-diphospho)-2-C-methyl-D-erythritol kinase [Prosthecochloris sp. CIB 2401]ANT64415.1 4-diphosphocytidyl-2-C-methyl-D-erythritol kinase [Prosthecochloris sp. CIB 2401]
MESITRRAFAKINVGLLITGKRPDGYHTLETVFAPIAWYDELTVSPAGELSMTTSIPDLPTDDTNLCMRAARALGDAAGTGSGAAIHLDKQVPFGAGLGGGSSDAALTLRLLDRLWGLDTPREELHRIAVTLGADVPYFLGSGGLAYASGIGEELEEPGLSLPFAVVTVFPGEHISTVWAYRNFYPRFERTVPDLRKALRALCTEADRSVLPLFENDFEPAVVDNFPVVGVALDELREQGCFYASLSGSGSAVFGLFDDEASAENAAAELGRRYRVSYTPPSFTMS